jgi:hypothetical protein
MGVPKARWPKDKWVVTAWGANEMKKSGKEK